MPQSHAKWLWSEPPIRGRQAAYRARIDSIAHRGRLCPAPLRVPAREFAAWTTDLPALLALARRVVVDMPAPDPSDPLTRLAEKWRDRPRMPPTMRADGLWTRHGLRLCELNMGPGAGGAWETEFMSHWLGVRPAPHDGIHSQMLEIAAQHGRHLAIAVLDEAGCRGESWYETRDLLSWLKRVPGVRAYCVATSALRLRGGRMGDSRRSFDLLYQSEALETRALGDPELLVMNEALASSTSFVVDPIDSRIDDKAVIALLSAAASGEFDFGLSRADRRLVRRYLPWTRLLGDGVAGVAVKTVLESREQLVLKRTRSLNSRHIIPGREQSPREWQRLVERAMRGRFRWVVQERLVPEARLVETPLGMERRACMICPFVFGGSWGGALVRVAEPEPRPFHIAGRPTVFLTVAVST